MPNLRPLQLTWCLVLLAFAGCGGGSATAEEALRTPLAAPGTWVVIGSSTAAGVGAPAGQAWVDLVAKQWHAQGVFVDRLARAGLQTTQALPLGTPLPPGRAKPVADLNIDAALARHPVLVLLSFPSNDAAARIPAAETVGHWHRIAARAAERSVATVVLGTQPRAAFDDGQRAILAETDRLAMAAFGPCHLPLHDVLAGPDDALAAELRSDDGDHLNAEGHARVAARVAAMLNDGRCVRLRR